MPSKDWNRVLAWRTGVKMMLAALLAFVIYRAINWPYGFWSIVTIAAVTRPGLEQTWMKSLMRIAGTAIGGLCALGLMWIGVNHTTLFISLFFIIVFLSGFLALQKNILSYMGIMIGLTLTIVVAASLGSDTPLQVMLYRFSDVGIGIAAIVVVNVVMRWLTPRLHRHVPVASVDIGQAIKQLWPLSRQCHLFKPALVTAMAASMTLLPWLHYRYMGGFWATISCFFIMEENMQAVQRKSFMRFFAHVVAAVVGGLLYWVFRAHQAWLVWPLMLSFFVFGYVMVRSKNYSTAANSMAIALTVMLLADAAHYPTYDVILARFIYVVLGIFVGMLLLYWFGSHEARD